MAKKNKFRTRVESIHEELPPNAGWGDAPGTGWDQGGWGQNETDQNQDGWQNAAARDNYVQPGDSISNASSNTDWVSNPPTPPTKDIQMQPPANGWGWGNATNEPVGKLAMKGRNQRSSAYGSPVALDMQSMLSAIAEQRQTQHNELTEQIRQVHQHAQDLAFAQQNAERGRSKHAREGSTSWGAQTSDVATSQGNRAPAGTHLGDAWGSAFGNAQNGNGSWAGAGEGLGSAATKSKRRRSKRGVTQAHMPPGAESKNDAWGNTAGQASSWGAAGGWDPAVVATSVTPGGFGAGTDGWGKAMGKANSQAPALIQSQSWNAWTDNGIQQNEVKEKTPKSGLSGLFSRIFGGKRKKKKKEEKKNEKEMEKIVWAEDTKAKGKKAKEKDVQEGKKGKVLKKQKFAEPEVHDEGGDDFDEDTDAGWEGGGDGWGHSGKGWGESAQAAAAPKRTSRASDGRNNLNAWSDTPHMKTSKTLAFAADERHFDVGRPRSGGHVAEHRIAESHRQALTPASAALFSKERLARDRILWFFDPGKDQRVSSVLEWIQHMQVPLAMFGFSKFFETKQRGALFTNVEFRSPSAPHEPAFDWITFDEIQATMDKIFQESLAYYDPASQIIVFVFLLSKSGRSMAVWRRKLPLPEIIRNTYGTQIASLVGSLNRPYPIHVDEIPAVAPGNRGASNTMKKWLAWGR